MQPDSPERAAPRLNPFAFPATTDSWFVLLALSLAAAVTYIFNWLAAFFPAYRSAVTGAALGCEEASARALAALNAAAANTLQDQSAQLDATRTYLECISGFQLQVALSSLSGIPLLLIFGGVLYWLLPHWIIRRRGLVELDPEDAADLLAGLADLSREAGLKRPPTFLGAPGWTSTDALAFGRFGRRFVGLDQGLITLFYTQPERFRAVVLHELAHLRNRDLDKAYLVVSFSIAFIVVGLVPLLISLVSQPLDTIGGLSLRALGLVALVALAGTSVLRSRESYADVRASTWSGGVEPLARLFETHSPGMQNRFRQLLRFHFDPTERKATLQDTGRLFRADFPEVLATGLVVALIIPRFSGVLSALFVRSGDSTLAPALTALALAPFLTGIIGLAIWRCVFANLANGMQPPPAGRFTLALTLGMVLGQFLAFDAFADVQSDLFALGLLTLLRAGVIALVLYGFMRWVAAGARSWLVAASADASPRVAYLSGLGLASLLLLVALAALIELQELSEGALVAPGFGLSAALTAFGFGLLTAGYVLFTLPVTGLAIVAVWAYPLAPLLWRHGDAQPSVAFWAFLEPAPRPARARVDRSGLRLALVVGAALGVIAGAVCLLIMLQYHSLPQEVRDLPSAKLQAYQVQALACIVLEVAAAIIVSWRAPFLPAAHGMLSAFIAAILGGAVLHVVIIAFGGSVDLEFVGTTYSFVVVLGGVVAMLASGLAATLSRHGAHMGVPGRSTWLAAVH